MDWRKVTPERFTYLTHAALAPGGEVFVCGQSGRLLRSRDGGDTWEPLKTLKKPFFTAVCAAPDGAVVLGDWKGNVQVSRDGGATFTGYKLRGMNAVRGLATNGRAVVAIGYQRVAWAPLGSDAWALAEGVPEGVWLQSVCADASGAFWACSRSRDASDVGAVVVSRDDGRTWSAAPLDGPQSLTAVASSGADVWALGTRDELLHGADGGTAWARVKLPQAAGEGSGWDALAVVGDALLVGGTYEKSVWLSEDRGATWREAGALGAESFAVTPAGRVLAVGSGGVFARDFPALAGKVAWPVGARPAAPEAPSPPASDAPADPWAARLTGLLEAWRATRSPRVAKLVEAVGERVAPVHAGGLASLDEARLQQRWIAAAQRGRAEDVTALLAELTRGTMADVEQRVHALEALADDPRVASAMAGFVERFTYGATSSKPIWTAAFRLLDRLADPRTARRVAAAERKPVPVKGATMREWLEGALRNAASTLPGRCKAAEKPLGPEASALCDAAEAALKA